MTVIEELDALIETVKAMIPGSMAAPANKKLESRFKKSLSNYFMTLADQFPYAEIDGIYNQRVKEVAPPKLLTPSADWGDWLDNFLKAFRTQLLMSVNGHLTTIYVQGSTQMMSYGKTKLGIPILYEGPSMSQAVNWAESYAAGLVTKMDIETRSQLAKVIADGIQNKSGIDGISRSIRQLFTDMSKNRADMISQTETNSALSHGMFEKMQDLGVDGKEWIPINPCEICQGNTDDGIIPIDEPFSSGDMIPPAHPNAVFEGYDFAPVGLLHQMLSSRYDGPAITIEAMRLENGLEFPSGNAALFTNDFDRNILGKQGNSFIDLFLRDWRRRIIAVFPERKEITIGPNHPILTGRGFIQAQFVREGDELFCDFRRPFSASGIEFDFEQVHLIEDIFSTLGTVFGYTTIPGASDYFHGDEIFCNGEIKVIRPKRKLLDVVNVGTLKHPRKLNFSVTDGNSKFMTRCGSCNSLRKRNMSTTDSGMSGGSHGLPFFRRLMRPPLFQSYRTISTHKTSFTGMAYDASTSTQLYSIGGLVVKNCVCTLSPARLDKNE